MRVRASECRRWRWRCCICSEEDVGDQFSPASFRRSAEGGVPCLCGEAARVAVSLAVEVMSTWCSQWEVVWRRLVVWICDGAHGRELVSGRRRRCVSGG